jgi:ABC-2 type transport system permease protein
LASLPSDVSSAIDEVGQMDLYSLIVGSVFFKIAGLLLPFIYAIMVSNNLIATQVDSGSMAYVLSTGTKRKTVVFTQACFLVLSLLAMFVCTLITSCICFSVVNVTNTGLNYGRLCLINLGAFLVLLAISGLNFFTSCVFDRTKHSMALGGGLSIFFLVATILGLFGSPVIPSVVRFEALNNFNYVSIITLFDVVSITKGTVDFWWKDAILLVIGLTGYLAGSARFIKKDLPL